MEFMITSGLSGKFPIRFENIDECRSKAHARLFDGPFLCDRTGDFFDPSDDPLAVLRKHCRERFH